MLLKDLEKLPEDVVGVIGEFLPLQRAVFLNKTNDSWTCMCFLFVLLRKTNINQ